MRELSKVFENKPDQGRQGHGALSLKGIYQAGQMKDASEAHYR